MPSHLGVAGNEEADKMAEQGRQQHPYNEDSLPKRRRPEQQWEELGLEEMSSGEGQHELFTIPTRRREAPPQIAPPSCPSSWGYH